MIFAGDKLHFAPQRQLQDQTTAESSPMNDDGIRQQLEMLKIEHRDMDAAIIALQGQGVPDQLQIARLKRRKLALKDQILRLEDQLVPDILA